jgi:hypothetical protein
LRVGLIGNRNGSVTTIAGESGVGGSLKRSISRLWATGRLEQRRPAARIDVRASLTNERGERHRAEAAAQRRAGQVTHPFVRLVTEKDEHEERDDLGPSHRYRDFHRRPVLPAIYLCETIDIRTIILLGIPGGLSTATCRSSS